MNTTQQTKTISRLQELAIAQGYVVVPRKEYEALRAKITAPHAQGAFKEFTPTAAEKRQLRSAREDFKHGKFISLYELKRKLGVKGA